MKSTILSLFILILIFALFKCGVLSVLGSQAFHVAAFAILAIVIVAAVYFVGFGNRDNQAESENVSAQPEDEVNEK